ncbi:hypothetical protein MNBD_GAMMA18-2452 [hydrothermal vent metagenome]|uniref:Uncharacterized protein n=1 Tax=hydrothermal vent metagenome TaxID=652676 RepID=A0A3B0ZY92_9ZZZZ
MAIEKVTDSVPHKRKGIEVQPSPLNHIKLELGVVLCVAVLVLLLAPSFSESLAVQLLILLGYGVIAGGWLVWRIRKTMAGLLEDSDGKDCQQ